MTTRILMAPAKPISVVRILRTLYTALPMSDAMKLVRGEKPLLDLSFSVEKRLRADLVAAGCGLADACSSCFDDDDRCVGECYTRYTHASFYPPMERFPDRMVAGSGYAFSTCCGREPDVLPPRVHKNIPPDELAEMLAKIDCPKCRDVLKVWGFLSFPLVSDVSDEPVKYVLNETDLVRCLGRLFVPTDGKAYNTDIKWKAENNRLTVTLEVGPPKDDGKEPDRLTGGGPDLIARKVGDEVKRLRGWLMSMLHPGRPEGYSCSDPGCPL